MLKKLFRRCIAIFESYGGEKARNKFYGELNYESGKLFFLLALAIFLWVPYIPKDFEMHPMLSLIIPLRFTLSVVGLIVVILKLTKTFRDRPMQLIMIEVAYVLVATAIIAATAGDFAPTYSGGFMLVIMLPIGMPIPLGFKIILASLSFVIYFIFAVFTGMDFNSSMTQYFIRDLFVALLFSIVFSIILNGSRRRAWEQRHELREAIKINKENLETISSLARKAELSDRAKSEFLATMSHEIRTPMNAIIGIAQIELHKGNLPEEYAIALGRIYNSGNSLLGIINDILDMSKIETGKLELNPLEYDMPSLINDAVQLNIVRIGSKQIEFYLDIDEKLPSRLYGDELRLKQILNNILSNAIKYTEKGQVKFSVKHDVNEEDITLRFTVEDTGQGMKEEDLKNLFSEYSRFNAEANRTTEGTGLGLSITKKLVELMDGNIKAESEYGKGTVFTVEVRQKTVECPIIGAELALRLRNFTFTGDRQAAKMFITRTPMPYGSVLVVDDVETNLFVAEGLLTPYKLNIETAYSGFNAIDKIKSGKIYDIIFMDHMMPKMDGIETTEKIRELGYKGTIVALTANALAGNDEMFKQKGFDGFIPKPIDIRQLNAALNKFIRDKYPEEAKKYKPETTAQADTTGINPKLIKVFCVDAEKAVETIKETLKNSDIKMFTTTAHAMKSALANVGENEGSAKAYELENAGLKGDMDFINANTESFIKTLNDLINKFKVPENEEIENADMKEDKEFLKEQLRIIKNACENYDDDKAFAALDLLKEKSWSKKTSGELEQIRDMLFIYSDFEGVVKRIEELGSD